MSRFVGIHLGLNHSSIAISDRGSLEIIPNAEGQKKTPSVVSFREGEALVGQHAKRQMITNPKSTIWSIQRHMGTTGWKFRVNGKDYIPQEISALILLKLKRDAEAYLGEPVTGAVITVPAYFNQSQRQATLEAGQIAGLRVERITPEPVAAALAYGINEFAEQTIMVVDLGSEICDLTILGTRGQGLEVQTTSRVLLGGDDWNQAITQFLADDFSKEHRIDLSNIDMAMQRVREAADRAKIEVSNQTEANIMIPFIATDSKGVIHLETTLTRSKFDHFTRHLLNRFAKSIYQVMEDSHSYPEDIDHIVLVGGSTRMPAIRRMLRRILSQDIRMGVSPDDAVVLGAALRACIINQGNKDVLLMDSHIPEDTVKVKDIYQAKTPMKSKNSMNALSPPDPGVADIGHNKNREHYPLEEDHIVRSKLIGKIPHNLWIIAEATKPNLVIVKDSILPASNTVAVSITGDYQDKIQVTVSENEHGIVGSPQTWGPFTISGLPQRPKGRVQVNCTIGVDTDGCIYLLALAKDTGKYSVFTISGSSTLAPPDIIQLVNGLERKRETYLQRTKLAEFMKLDIYSVLLDRVLVSLYEQVDETDPKIRQQAYRQSSSLIELSQAYEAERKKLEGYLKLVLEGFNDRTLKAIIEHVTADPIQLSLTRAQEAHSQLMESIRPILDRYGIGKN